MERFRTTLQDGTVINSNRPELLAEMVGMDGPPSESGRPRSYLVVDLGEDGTGEPVRIGFVAYHPDGKVRFVGAADFHPGDPADDWKSGGLDLMRPALVGRRVDGSDWLGLRGLLRDRRGSAVATRRPPPPCPLRPTQPRRGAIPLSLWAAGSMGG